MKWVVAIFAVLVLAGIVNALTYSGPGFFITSNCNNITNPVTNATVCWQTSTAGLFYWNGTAFVNAIGSTMVSTIPTPPPCSIYAAPTGGSGTACSIATPCTIAQASLNATHPGDRICVNDGTVTYVSGFGVINASATGGTLSQPVWYTPTNYQTLITGPTTINQPHVLVSLVGQNANTGGIVFSGTSNVVVAGFEIAGTGTEGGNSRGVYMRANVFNDGTNHQYAYNNLIHDLGGGGISCNFMDYCTIQGNIVYNTAGNETDCGSNISVYTPIQIDGIAGCHITVAGNISHDAHEFDASCQDGEGIILDDWDHTQTDNVPYTEMGCVENNLIYNNISDGIEVFEGTKGSVKRIRNNTTYNNATDPRNFGGQGARAEIIGIIATNMEVANNIVQPSTTGNAGLSVGLSEHISPAGSTVYVGNMCWAPGGQNCWWSGTGGDVNPFQQNYFNVNPQWVNPPIDFQLTAASPAINAGYNNYGQPTTDILSFVRPNRMDLGAYLGLQ